MVVMFQICVRYYGSFIAIQLHSRLVPSFHHQMQVVWSPHSNGYLRGTCVSSDNDFANISDSVCVGPSNMYCHTSNNRIFMIPTLGQFSKYKYSFYFTKNTKNTKNTRYVKQKKKLKTDWWCGKNATRLFQHITRVNNIF